MLDTQKKPSQKRAGKPPPSTPEGEKRIVADVPERIHRQVRMKAFERGIEVRAYILELLAKDGVT